MLNVFNTKAIEEFLYHFCDYEANCKEGQTHLYSYKNHFPFVSHGTKVILKFEL